MSEDSDALSPHELPNLRLSRNPSSSLIGVGASNKLTALSVNTNASISSIKAPGEGREHSEEGYDQGGITCRHKTSRYLYWLTLTPRPSANVMRTLRPGVVLTVAVVPVANSYLE